MSNAEAKNNKDSNSKGVGPTRSFDSSALGPGSQVGLFRIERELGRGAVGVVYLAHDTKLDRPVAIKSLPAEVMSNPKVQKRWKREARVLASLNHPNIATIYEELEEAEGLGYLILEYVPGQTLAERIAKRPIKLEEALSIALQIAEAVAAAHEHDVIHRDLKPLLVSKYNEHSPALSPDGKWLAYVSDELGRNEVFVTAFPGLEGKWQVSTETGGGREPVWAPNSKAIYYRDGASLIEVSIDTEGGFSTSHAKPLFDDVYVPRPSSRNYDIHPSGEQFLMIKENQEDVPSTEFIVVENWFEELKRLVPTGKKQ